MWTVLSKREWFYLICSVWRSDIGTKNQEAESDLINSDLHDGTRYIKKPLRKKVTGLRKMLNMLKQCLYFTLYHHAEHYQAKTLSILATLIETLSVVQ